MKKVIREPRNGCKRVERQIQTFIKPLTGFRKLNERQENQRKPTGMKLRLSPTNEQVRDRKSVNVSDSICIVCVHMLGCHLEKEDVFRLCGGCSTLLD